MASFRVTKLSPGSIYNHPYEITYTWFETGEKSMIKNEQEKKLPVILFGFTTVEKKRNYG